MFNSSEKNIQNMKTGICATAIVKTEQSILLTADQPVRLFILQQGCSKKGESGLDVVSQELQAETGQSYI